jgi:hypothetical protein
MRMVISLLIPTTFEIGGKTTFKYWMYIISVVLGRKNTSQPIVHDPSPFEFEITISDLKKYKLPSSDQILAELTQAGGETLLLSEIHKLINSICNKEELHDQWMESIILQSYKKGDETDCSNYHGISLLSTSNRSPYIDEIAGDHHCGFQCNRSTTDQIFCVHQIL